MAEGRPGIRSTLDTVVGLAITQMVLGILCVVLEYAVVEQECYLYNIGVPLWSGTLFLTTGGIGCALSKDQSPKLARDYFSLSIISTFVAMVVVTYGSVAAWADYQDGRSLQGGIDIALAAIGFTEMCIAIASAVVAADLRAHLKKFMPLRTVSTFQTNKDRTIILMPMSSDEIPILYLPDGHTVADVKIKN